MRSRSFLVYQLPNHLKHQLIDNVTCNSVQNLLTSSIFCLQIYGFLSFWTKLSTEVKVALNVARWISASGGLPAVLPEKVYPDVDKLALAGHSRGGKAAFTLALANNAAPDDPTFKALIGIDPSAGMGVSCRIAPNILDYVPRSLDMSVPVAIVGAGLSNQWFCMFPPFAANGVNHSEFFNESKPPACYFRAKNYGHCDMMDDKAASLASLMMKSGKGSRELMRKTVAGVVVAFLEAYLDGQENNLTAIVDKPSVAPISLDPVIYVQN